MTYFNRCTLAPYNPSFILKTTQTSTRFLLTSMHSCDDIYGVQSQLSVLKLASPLVSYSIHSFCAFNRACTRKVVFVSDDTLTKDRA